ncbi:hypothetical protein Pcinc_019877 [Petrolisthes cinctipes]|uniref:Uncharacterized protein n=1 Tax=Petrolisthes cinctipes TaxID=88211 RepID=A0AAE1FJB2_PETCI|nr:hypothetical protein Pcinc_019877 [Petrolisthes cinctipes]
MVSRQKRQDNAYLPLASDSPHFTPYHTHPTSDTRKPTRLSPGEDANTKQYCSLHSVTVVWLAGITFAWPAILDHFPYSPHHHHPRINRHDFHSQVTYGIKSTQRINCQLTNFLAKT